MNEPQTPRAAAQLRDAVSAAMGDHAACAIVEPSAVFGLDGEDRIIVFPTAGGTLVLTMRSSGDEPRTWEIESFGAETPEFLPEYTGYAVADRGDELLAAGREVDGTVVSDHDRAGRARTLVQAVSGTPLSAEDARRLLEHRRALARQQAVELRPWLHSQSGYARAKAAYADRRRNYLAGHAPRQRSAQTTDLRDALMQILAEKGPSAEANAVAQRLDAPGL